jgi:4-hydroxybenzoate polyprenyltransferase
VLGLGMLLFQFSIGTVNDIVDVEDDRIAKPWKPLPSGRVSRSTAVLLAAASAGAGLLVTFGLPLGAWLVGLAGLACGLSYDVVLKRTVLSWIPWSIALPLIPTWVFLAAGEWSGLLWWTYPLGALLGLSLYFANQSPDIPVEQTLGVRGAAHRMGAMRSRLLAMAAFGLAASLVVVVLVAEERSRAPFAAVTALVVALLSSRSERLGRDGLFGILAGGGALLGAIFLSAA